MAKKKKDDSGEPKPPGKVKTAMVPVGIFLLGIIVGQKVLGGGGGTTVVEASATETSVVETVETTVPEGETISLGESTVTLADGHQLKFGLAVRLVPVEAVVEEEETATESSGHGAEATTTEAVVDPNEVGTEWLEALDLAVSVFGSHTMAELQSPQGRAEAKELLAEQLRAAYPDEVDEVFLNPFVMV
jgi:flagellar FliL protein